MIEPAYDDRGLVPCIVEDADLGTVQLLAWMNADALRLTRADVRASRTPDGMRQIGRIRGDADFATLLGSKRSDRGFECVATPTGFEFGST
ncbi:MAG TPA: hypothetical protein VHT91_50375 [Kofleriaceae bacterium]|nr:hypothetical protein [Kofleriaceae bacterium]